MKEQKHKIPGTILCLKLKTKTAEVSICGITHTNIKQK